MSSSVPAWPKGGKGSTRMDVVAHALSDVDYALFRVSIATGRRQEVGSTRMEACCSFAIAVNHPLSTHTHLPPSCPSCYPSYFLPFPASLILFPLILFSCLSFPSPHTFGTLHRKPSCGFSICRVIKYNSTERKCGHIIKKNLLL